MKIALRIGFIVAALLVATVAVSGQLAGLLGGQVRLQAPDAALAPPYVDHQGHSGTDASRPAAVQRPNAARVQLAIAPAAKASTGYVLTAGVLTATGGPASDVTVRFYEVVDLLGTREMLIGAATADGHGSASLTYLPATIGTHEVVVRASGTAVSPGETRGTLDATVAAPPYRSDVSALSRFSAVVPYAVGLVVLAVWLLIAFALFGTARGVIQGAGSEREKRVIA